MSSSDPNHLPGQNGNPPSSSPNYIPAVSTVVGGSNRIIPYQQTQSAPQASNESSEESGGSLDLLGAIWRRRWWVVVSLLTSLSAGALYYYNATPIYASVAQLYIAREGPKIITDSGQFVGSSTGFLATQSQVMLSSAILANVVKNPEIQNAKTLSKEATVAIGELRGALSVKVNEKSEVMNVVGESASPEDAALFVNTTVTAYIDHTSRNRRATAGDILAIVNREKARQETAIEQLYEKMIAFKRLNGNVQIESFNKQGVLTSRLSELTNSLTNVQLELLDLNRLKAAVDKAGENIEEVQYYMQAFPTITQSLGVQGVDPELANRLSFTRANYNARKLRVGAGNTELAIQQKELESMQNELRESQLRSATQFANALIRRVEWLADSEAQLRRSVEKERQNYLDQSAVALEYVKMQSELERANKNIDLLDSRIKELAVNAEDVGNLTVTVLENAGPARRPARPVPAQIMAMAGVLGLMLGVGLALLRDWMDPRLNSLTELRASIDGPILGVIPHVDAGLARNRLEVVVAPKSPVAEAYRMIRTAVYFESPDANAKTILITSPQPGDGKSTLASNLAAALALAGKRTLLIDADCRKPVQNRAFQVTENKGLAGVLLGQISIKDAIQNAGLEHLDLLVCGEIPDSPSELLGRPQFDDLLNYAREHYDRVIIDSPPIVPVTDARIIAARCDQVLLVVRAGRTSRNAIQFASQMIQRIGTPLIGVVVNDAQKGTRSAYNYGDYGNYYVYESRKPLASASK